MNSFFWKTDKKSKILLLAYVHFRVIQGTIRTFLELLKENFEDFNYSFPAISIWVKIPIICKLK